MFTCPQPFTNHSENIIIAISFCLLIINVNNFLFYTVLIKVFHFYPNFLGITHFSLTWKQVRRFLELLFTWQETERETRRKKETLPNLRTNAKLEEALVVQRSNNIDACVHVQCRNMNVTIYLWLSTKTFANVPYKIYSAFFHIHMLCFFSPH